MKFSARLAVLLRFVAQASINCLWPSANFRVGCMIHTELSSLHITIDNKVDLLKESAYCTQRQFAFGLCLKMQRLQMHRAYITTCVNHPVRFTTTQALLRIAIIHSPGPCPCSDVDMLKHFQHRVHPSTSSRCLIPRPLWWCVKDKQFIICSQLI